MFRKVHSAWWKVPHIFAISMNISARLAQPKWYLVIFEFWAQCGISPCPLRGTVHTEQFSSFAITTWNTFDVAVQKSF